MTRVEKIREKKSITQIFNIVQSEVRDITDNEQSPVIYNQLKASVFLAGKPEPEKIPSKAGKIFKKRLSLDSRMEVE